MSSKPRFSIVAPVYNTSAFLSECLDSVEQQTYRNFELVLVDDGSTDNSGKMCDEFAAQHAYARVIHQENQGLLLARVLDCRQLEESILLRSILTICSEPMR